MNSILGLGFIVEATLELWLVSLERNFILN